jgi:cholest-4-en-3-one 26-monooxygenase
LSLSRETAIRDQIELQRFVMLNIDPPKHNPPKRKLRGVVSRGFTPRAASSARPCRRGPSGS